MANSLKWIFFIVSIGMQAIHYSKGDKVNSNPLCIAHWDDFRPGKIFE